MRAALVYQGGIANVFQLQPGDDCPELPAFGKEPGRHRRRMLQHAFDACLWFASGLKAAGWQVETFGCQQMGDAANLVWTRNLADCPFADKLREV